jgi:hypothetical protein
MAICPLLKAECIKHECQWWQEKKTKKFTGCLVTSLPDRIDDICNRLDIAFSQININGERLIGNYTDELEEITEIRKKEDK